MCGHSGATYRSECAAWAGGTSVDYNGHCKTVGYLKGMRTLFLMFVAQARLFFKCFNQFLFLINKAAQSDEAANFQNRGNYLELILFI